MQGYSGILLKRKLYKNVYCKISLYVGKNQEAYATLIYSKNTYQVYNMCQVVNGK